MGVELALSALEVAGMRKWEVRDFEKSLIFYRPRPHGVSIVRVLRAAQDWWSVLGLAKDQPWT
jgi:toxin ParE1/3/4